MDSVIIYKVSLIWSKTLQSVILVFPALSCEIEREKSPKRSFLTG